MGEIKNCLQSIGIPYILVCSIVTIPFEDKVCQKLLNKKEAIDLYII